MSDEFDLNDELKKLGANRRNKVNSFSLNISDIDEDADNDDFSDDIIFPDDIDDDEFDDTNDSEEVSIPSRSKIDDDAGSSKRDEERHRRAALKAEKKRKKKKAKKNGCVFRVVWGVFVIILGVFLAEFLLVGINDFLGRNRAEEEKTIIVRIPEAATIDRVAEILHENEVIGNEGYFKLYANVTKSGIVFTQGSYEMKNTMDYEAIISYLQSDMNRVDTVSIQFTEGMTVLEIADKLDENEVCDKDEFLELCNSDEFDEDFTFLTADRKNLSGVYYKLEGYLFPDTYEFYQGESAKKSIYRFLNNYEARIYYTKQRVEIKEEEPDPSTYYGDTDTSKKNTKKYEKLTVEEQAKRQGMTMDELMIYASMIQAEAANVDDMYVISSIFHNRVDTLKDGKGGYTDFGENINGTMGSDPTIFYPYKKNTAPANFESTYNTYKIKGLPAGSVCNPGMDAIKAALYPEDTNYYFFCHKAATEDSEAVAYYASTNADHNYNMTLAGLK